MVSGTIMPPMALCWTDQESGACGWSVVQLDQGRGGGTDAWDVTLDAELEVQRTIERAEPTAFLCLRNAIGAR